MRDRPRIRGQVREGAEVLEVREGTLLDCRRAERRILKELNGWHSRPKVPLRLGGDTECLRIDAPVGRLSHWFHQGDSESRCHAAVPIGGVTVPLGGLSEVMESARGAVGCA